MNPKPTFSFEPLRRCFKAEERREYRREGFGLKPLSEIWEVKVTESRDYHRVGDIVILELA